VEAAEQQQEGLQERAGVELAVPQTLTVRLARRTLVAVAEGLRARLVALTLAVTVGQVLS
jgi:hypothetical protein